MGLEGVLSQIPLGVNLFFYRDFVPISETSVSDRGSKRLSPSAPGHKDCNALLSLFLEFAGLVATRSSEVKHSG